MVNQAIINTREREYNSSSEYPLVLTINKDENGGWEEKSFEQDEKLIGKEIYGLYIIAQSDTAAKKSYVRGNQLLSNNALKNAYLTLYKDGTLIASKIPLESLVRTDATPFRQLILPQGITQKECTVDIDISKLDADIEDLVIHFLIDDDNNCVNLKYC